MRKFENFLFFYSILTVTILFISFGVFVPKPANVISILVLSPIIFYFYIRLTNPEKISAEKWSIRFILSLFVLSSLGIFGYRLSLIPLPQTLPPVITQPSLVSTFPPTASKSAVRTGESVADLIAGSSTPVALLEITGRPGVKTITVYKDPALSSKKISTLDGTQTYLYLEKQNGWYKVVLSDSAAGWINGADVGEVTN